MLDMYTYYLFIETVADVNVILYRPVLVTAAVITAAAVITTAAVRIVSRFTFHVIKITVERHALLIRDIQLSKTVKKYC